MGIVPVISKIKSCKGFGAGRTGLNGCTSKSGAKIQDRITGCSCVTYQNQGIYTVSCRVKYIQEGTVERAGSLGKTPCGVRQIGIGVRWISCRGNSDVEAATAATRSDRER